MFTNIAKAKLKAGEAILGTFFNSYSPDIAEALGAAGLDYIIIDCEHGPGSPEGIVNSVRAAEARGMSPIARIPELSRTSVLRYLDIGAHGILIPQLESVDQAEQAVQFAKYAPIGIRGMAVPRASTWGMDGAAYTQTANDETLICVQCENLKCLECVEDVAKVPSVDVVFLGPYDMSQALGVPGQVHHPLVVSAKKRILSAALDAGKSAGLFVNTIEEAVQARDEGWKFILMGMDISTIGLAYQKDMAAFRG